jgi:hypothetical protein
MTEATRKLFAKYKGRVVKNATYQGVISKVLEYNYEKTSKAIARITAAQWDQNIKKLKGKKIIKPQVDDVLPKRSVFAIKSADRGKIIAETVYDKITKNIRDTLAESKTLTVRAGRTAGVIKLDAVRALRKKITETFEEYTGRGTEGVPSNVRNIAVTELYSNRSFIEDEYIRQLLQRNPGMKVVKTWKQNKKAAKKPRANHTAVNGQTVDYRGMFKVPAMYKGKLTPHVIMMKHPHDPNAPAGEVIGCSCQAIYKIINT